MTELRTGIIGVGGYGKKILAELGRNESYQIQAIADQNRELASELARQYEAEPYDDYRSLIVQENLDVLFLSLPTFLCGECIQSAAKKKIHVFKEAPLARTLPEAIEWVEVMDKAGVKFHVGAQRRFAPGYLQAQKLIQEERIGSVYLIRAESFEQFGGQFGWRGDPVLSGGGVLLEQAYHLIDQIVLIQGPPERVYGLHTDWCKKRTLPPYRTEDTLVLTMKFPNGAMGNLLTSWKTGAQSERVLLHGTEGAIEVGINQLRVFDVEGNVVSEETYQVDEAWLIAQQVRHFAESLVDEEIKPVSTAREHCVNVAIVESGYLSARTKQPETLKVYGNVFELD